MDGATKSALRTPTAWIHVGLTAVDSACTTAVISTAIAWCVSAERKIGTTARARTTRSLRARLTLLRGTAASGGRGRGHLA